LDNETFTDHKVNDPLVQQALSKVQVVIDESIPEPGTYCPVTIQLKTGKRLSHTARIAKGHPENPMTESEVLEKFRNNAREIISEKRSEQVIAALQSLEEVDNVRNLTGFLRPAESHRTVS
jgi:2-methylcitrate dehydratase PrpD